MQYLPLRTVADISCISRMKKDKAYFSRFQPIALQITSFVCYLLVE